MKTLLIFFTVFCVGASIILLKITRDGASIRSAPIIGPSPQGEEYKNVGPAVVTRLFPDFQMSHYVVIGSPKSLTAGPQIINDIKIAYEKQFQKNVNLIADNEDLSEKALEECSSPCWILTTESQANELVADNKIIQALNKMKNINHFHLTLIPFSSVPEPSQECVSELRLSLKCLIPLSIHEVRKKFKDPAVSYFFMRKYQDRDYFLFIQTAK